MRHVPLLKPACPASEVVRPVTSPNEAGDSKCRINGHLQPADGSLCCERGYEGCMIWRVEINRTRHFGDHGFLPKTRKARVTDEVVGPRL